MAVGKWAHRNAQRLGLAVGISRFCPCYLVCSEMYNLKNRQKKTPQIKIFQCEFKEVNMIT
jgi:hypothetical protein